MLPTYCARLALTITTSCFSLYLSFTAIEIVFRLSLGDEWLVSSSFLSQENSAIFLERTHAYSPVHAHVCSVCMVHVHTNMYTCRGHTTVLMKERVDVIFFRKWNIPYCTNQSRPGAGEGQTHTYTKQQVDIIIWNDTCTAVYH